jgi:hypothetical protein
MKKLITTCAMAVVVLVGIVLTSTASATILGTVNIQNHGNGLSDTGRLWSPSLGSGSGGSYYTGIYSWTNAGDTLVDAEVPGWGFCIELTQGPYNGLHDVINLNEAPLPESTTYGTPMGTIKANYIRELWYKHFDPAWTIGPKDDTESKMAETFGVCIWEIIYEDMPGSPGSQGPWDVTQDGTAGERGFYCANVDTATANDWLHLLTGTSDPAYLAPNLYAISPTNHAGQDYLVQIPGLGIPEPATICLLGFGALSLIRRKK